MKILVSSDLHLSNRIWNHRAIEGDSYWSWKQIVSQAIKHKVEAVILAGDILDKQVNSSEPIQKLLSGVDELSENNIPVYYTQGQHEFQETPWLKAAFGAAWLHDQTVQFRNWKITGCDYQNNEEKLLQFLKSEKALNSQILVCHQVWEDFMGELAKPQGCFKDIPSNVKYLITGDYHKNLIHTHGNLTILSPGSTHMRNITEPEDKAIFLIEDDPLAFEQRLTIKILPLVTRRKIVVSTTDCLHQWDGVKSATNSLMRKAAEYATAANLPAELIMPLIYLVYTPADTELVDRFKQTFEQKGHLFFKQIESKQAEDQAQEQVLAADRISMLQCVDNYVNKAEQPLVYDLIVTLLQSPDSNQALKLWVNSNI